MRLRTYNIIVAIISFVILSIILTACNEPVVTEIKKPSKQAILNKSQSDSINYYCCKFIELRNLGKSKRMPYLDSIQAVSRRRELTIKKLTQ